MRLCFRGFCEYHDFIRAFDILRRLCSLCFETSRVVFLRKASLPNLSIQSLSVCHQSLYDSSPIKDFSAKPILSLSTTTMFIFTSVKIFCFRFRFLQLFTLLSAQNLHFTSIRTCHEFPAPSILLHHLIVNDNHMSGKNRRSAVLGDSTVLGT